MKKNLLFILVLGISLFTFLTFTKSSALADSSCIEYTQPNNCTVGPDKESGRLFIVTKCSVNGQTNYSCFNVDTGIFYTQPNTCTVGPYYGNTSGHTYLVKKEGTNSFYCVADCTKAPGLPHCPQPPTPTPSPTPSGPTPTLTPTAAPVPTTLNVAIKLPGIGQGGNLSPQHLMRTVHISIYAANADPSQPNVTPVFDSKTQQVKYDSGTGYFTNPAVNIGTLPTGDYQVLFKSPGYLRKEVVNPTDQTTTIHITGATTNQIPAATLIVGDVAALYNVMDISDFYGLVGCYQAKATSSTCTIGAQMADLNDDGVVDGIDLNYWLLGMNSALQSNSTNPGSGDGVTGD